MSLRTIRHNYEGKRVIFDLDSIIADLMNPWLDWYNREWGDTLKLADINTYHIEQHVKPACGWRVFEFFRGPEGSARYGAIPIYAGATEGLKALHDNGVDVVIATATAGSTAPEKYAIAKKAAPWLDKHHILIGTRKEIIHGDFFVDDAPKNMLAYAAEWPDTHILTIGHPYNTEFKGKIQVYAEGCFNTAKAWKEIVDYILSTDP